MHKVVVTGGPDSEKGNLYAALRERYPKASHIADARRLISRKGAVPRNPSEFADKEFKMSFGNELQIPEDTQLVIMRKSLVDIYGWQLAKNVPTDQFLHRAIRSAGYTLALFCEPTKEVKQSYTDRQQAAHDQVFRAYKDFDIDVLTVPSADIADRLAVSTEAIDFILSSSQQE